MRIALVVQYKGSNYYGWQKQVSASPTIEELLELAIGFVANHKVKLFCAGRTDTGVHSTYQVVHFDTFSVRDKRSWLFGINSKLPIDIRVNFVTFVNNEFHARFSALFRRYNYIIDLSTVPEATLCELVTSYPYSLNISKMNKAASYLLGEQDFSSFRAAKCQSKTANRDIKEVNVYKNNNFVIIDIKANAFLYHMVRNIVGALFIVGRELQTVAWFEQLIKNKDRTKAPATASAKGLYLVEVGYNKAYSLAEPKELIFNQMKK